MLIGFHSEEDTFRPWKYAHEIYEAFDHGRAKQNLSSTTLLQVQPCKKRPSYNYGPQAMELFLQLAFGDAERVLESHPRLCQPTSLPVSGGLALSSQVDASLVSSSGQSSRGHRSRSPKPAVVDTTTGPVGMVPRCPVGQDGPLPVDHIGYMTLTGGMKSIYIAHSGKSNQDLWSNAVIIGKSTCIATQVYFDHDESNALCERIRSALSETRGRYKEAFFQCTQVGNVVAVGLGGNKNYRLRASRISAAVCYQLQAATQDQDLLGYPALQSLIKQVGSLCTDIPLIFW